MYTKEDGIKLLRLARESIEEEFSGKKAKTPEEKKFSEKRGVFVTLKKRLPLQKVSKDSGLKSTELRGCIGFPYPVLPLYEAVRKAAKSAAFSDFRFLPLQKDELNDIEIEISILTIPRECECKDVEVGKDGLMCNYLGYQGLLLPQVAVENKFTRIQFLDCLCDKIGLDREKWKDKDFKLWKFSCEIFNEGNKEKIK